MLWQAQHGATAEEYRKELDRRGAPIPAHFWPPEVLPGLDEWLLAFWELSTERRLIGGPIPWSALAAWPVDPAEAETFRHVMREVDRAYLAFLNKPPEERQSLPPAGPQNIKKKAKE